MNNTQFEAWLKGCPYPVQVFGKSVCKQNLYAIFAEFNRALPWCIITAGIHAREHLSTDVVVTLIQMLTTYKSLNCNICFVPLVNPDGADIATQNVSKFSIKTQKKLIKINKSQDFCLYKANARGVDLNNNFNANWHAQFTKNHCPASAGYYGKRPFSEPETKALRRLTKKLCPVLSLSFHLKGEEIYFDFFQTGEQFKRDQQIAQIFAKHTGYKIVPTQSVSSGGYKDWCVQKLKISALTIELGSDDFAHPYPQTQLKDMIQKNSHTFECISQAVEVINKFSKF